MVVEGDCFRRAEERRNECDIPGDPALQGAQPKQREGGTQRLGGNVCGQVDQARKTKAHSTTQGNEEMPAGKLHPTRLKVPGSNLAQTQWAILEE